MTPEEIAKELLADRVKLTGFIRSLVNDRHLADDLFQEVCVKAIAKPEIFEGVPHLFNWCRTVAKNRAIDHHRKQERQGALLGEKAIELLAADEMKPSIQDNVPERLQALEHCLVNLTPKSRQVLRLRYAEELEGTEVARRLNRKVDTVYKLLARTYVTLRKCIETQMTGGKA